MTKHEIKKIKSICKNHNTTLDDLIELVDYHQELWKSGEIEKAQAIEYGLFEIFQNAKKTKIKMGVVVAMVEIERNKNLK